MPGCIRESHERTVLITSLYEADCHFEKWKKKRKITTIMFMVFALLLGLEYSAITVSLWYYLNDFMKVDHVKIYYSVTMLAMALAAIICNLFIGRYVDNNRSVRRVMMLISFISVIGNLLYTLHFSVVFLIVGRLLCGISDSLVAIMCGK